jgi:hypothetical protein
MDAAITFGRLVMSALAAAAGLVVSAAAAAHPPADQVRVVGPKVMSPGAVHLVYAEGKPSGAKDWHLLEPDGFTVEVTGAGKLVEDPAAVAMNPVTVELPLDAAGEVTVSLQAAGKSAAQAFKVAEAKPAGEFMGSVDVKAVTHRFEGLGAGVLFYDNQFEISTTGDIYDWCFKDVAAEFLHVLIRPDYEPANDNDDWQSLDLSKFDFKSTERPFRIAKEALERNPDLKVFASLYTPPAWMKTNDSTAGNGSLKSGPKYRREMAEYVLAYLRHARAEKIPVQYLGFFNEPDFAHTQDGMHVADLSDLAELFRDCTAALDKLMAADEFLKDPKRRPVYVFPDTLGPGSITRAGPASKKLRGKAGMLNPVGVWGVHDYWYQSGDYWDKRYRELRAFPGVGKKPIWMTEWAQRDRRGDLASGVEYGRNILNAVRLGAGAWMAFEWCHPAGNQSGLISTDWGPGKPTRNYWRSKAYHVFRQVANTTPGGSEVLAMNGRWNGQHQANGRGVEFLALKSDRVAKSGDVVIVHLMNSEPAPTKYQIRFAGPVKNVRERFLTTPAINMAKGGERHASLSNPGNGMVLTGTIPPFSLLTVELK